MITSAWKFGSNVSEVLEIRNSVSRTADPFDEKSIHLIIFNDNAPAGCGSLYFDNGAYHIAHLCVKPELQRQYIGDLMIRLLLVKGFNMMADKIAIACNDDVTGFFQKFGFRSVAEKDGIIYMEVTAATLTMNSKCGHDCSKCINKDSCTSK